MALQVKKIADILVEIRDTLQDLQKNRWSDQELYRYLSQGIRDIYLTLKCENIKHEITVDPALPNVYDLPYEAIEFFKIHTVQPFTYTSTTITFPDNRAEDVIIDYYAYPDDIIYGVTIEIEEERDIQDMLKYYVLYRAYEKEDSAENINKSSMFYERYNQAIARNTTRWDNYDQPVDRQDYYTQ